MHQLTLKVVESRNRRPAGDIELPDSRDQEVSRDLVGFLELAVFVARHSNIDLPCLGSVVPARFLHGAVEPDVFIQAVFGRDID